MDNKYNYIILNTSGSFFAYCSKKKRENYISKNLCKVIDNVTIQLTFEPKIKDTSKFTYLFSTEGKQSSCMVCGTTEENTDLNKMYIIPIEFLKWFPDKT